MNFNTKVAVITFTTFFGLLIVGVVLIVVLTRPTHVVTSRAPVLPTPSTVPPPVGVNILLKNSDGLCYQFDNLGPVLGAPEKCTGFWIVNSTTQTITFDATVYETCIAPATISGIRVQGTIGTGCNSQSISPSTGRITVTDGVVLEGSKIRSTKTNLCITQFGTDLTWGDCSSAYEFVVETL